ncbi:uncharacterized protein LOC129598053 [Paramacrobiotus metropolitanus]|uniref:uncharacterized protein LOC129598053 n=1 Tax=Paramacrobiotus metropolitanus TaxID=2943436 RepID=UPI002445E702|nr:uncharacterized protein LOC129598053 [Paramacrobiotus metropolitanus]
MSLVYLSIAVIWLQVAVQWSRGAVISSEMMHNHNRDPRAVRTTNTAYGLWPNPQAILYRIGAGFTATDTAGIQAAMAQISADMNNCIRFQPYTNVTNAGTDFIQISQTLSSPTTASVSTATCFSFPGRVVRQAGNGQTLLMVGGVDGCLSSTREIMKYLVNSLGIRNEMNRPDRNGAIQVVADNQLKPGLQNLGITTILPAATTTLLTTNFDYKSITMPAVTKYVNTGNLYSAVGGAALPTTGNTAPGNLARLSQGDCLGLRILYPTTCTAAVAPCPDNYGGTGASTANANAATGTGTGTVINGTPGGTPLEPPQTGNVQF